MGSILDTNFQYFPGKIYKTKPLGEVTLRQFIEAHKSPKKKILELFDKIAEAERVKDFKLKAELKQNNLFYFTPSVKLNGRGRSYEDVVSFNPLMILEYDHIEEPEIFRDLMFDRCKSIVCGWVSPSRKGAKFMLKIPTPTSVEDYKSYFCGAAYSFSRFEGFDPANFNCILPLFISFDKDMKFREDAVDWTVRGEKINKIVQREVEPVEGVTRDDLVKIYEKVFKVMQRADEEQNGHRNVVAASMLLGGFCGAGYMEDSLAETMAFDMIDKVDYLQKSLQTYKKTAVDMIQRGKTAPLTEI